MTIRSFLMLTGTALLVACGGADAETPAPAADVVAETEVPQAAIMAFDGAALDAALGAQSDEAKARFDQRNPRQTLEFFDIAPGMAVGDALPGGGWYTKILLPYLGEDGRMVGVDYDLELWPNFNFGDDDFIEGKRSWPETWTAQAREWTDTDIDIDAYTFATLPEDGSLDAFLFIRALHNLNRFEDGRFMTEALDAVNGALKPGGIVGVVQHEGPADASDEWSTGANGYLRKADVIAAFDAAGFELVGESDINANPLDMPTEEDAVWRLRPTLGGSADKPELRDRMAAIGESNRMTLKFRKL